ncbi:MULTISPECIES: stage III sporulation protein AG [unclassified Clostridium]|uniref:stage III sporulation protein AG n=1 Tax=unclassified Clostridium TaxID=2614128 RepID=UPI0002981F99|nr:MULTISPECIES: stage III sporulation protein AG [unclassified Clostridium]EKQ58209.1 MAG: stage III sporulation protein AG [Clostridium sp. Maddingley MBC34-26]
MDKDKLKNEISKILGQKPLKNLIAVCLILAFALIAMNVLYPTTTKSLSSSNISETTTNQVNVDKTKAPSEVDAKDYEEKQKNDLKNILKKMDGVGDVEVMMSFENGEEKVPAYDKNTQKSTTEETDTEGGKRVNNQDTDSSKIVMSTSDGNNQPFILKTYKPKIIGVIVLAEGAENSKIKYEIEQAVSKLYNLSLDKVNVYSMKK